MALTGAPASSHIYVFTDAIAKDIALKDTILALMRSTKSTVRHLLLLHSLEPHLPRFLLRTYCMLYILALNEHTYFMLHNLTLNLPTYCMLYILPLNVRTNCMLYILALIMHIYCMVYILALNVRSYCMLYVLALKNST